MSDHDSFLCRSTSPPFPSTHWSVVLAAGTGSRGAEKALEQICRKYWRPLYAYVRHRGYRPEDAEDLTQEFLTRFIEKRYLGLADPLRGRFRSFFLTALKHFLHEKWLHEHAAKRGGGRKMFSFETSSGLHATEPAHNLTPDKLFDQHWCEALLEAVLRRLTDEHETNGRRDQFEVLKRFLWGSDGSVTYAEIAVQLAISPSAVKSAVRRLRVRCAALLRDEVAQTVSSAEELEDELRWLRKTFA